MSSGVRTTFFGPVQVGKATAGKARVCPHCKATILDSSSICPACHRYLRYEQAPEDRPAPELSPLRVAATIQHPDAGEPWEYSVVLSVSNDRGEEISRQVVGVGALQPREQRTFHLTVDVFPHAARRR
jgi:hypothetical protein